MQKLTIGLFASIVKVKCNLNLRFPLKSIYAIKYSITCFKKNAGIQGHEILYIGKNNLEGHERQDNLVLSQILTS